LLFIVSFSLRVKQARRSPSKPEARQQRRPQKLAARELGISRTSAYAILWSGQVPSMKIGRLRKIRREDVEAFIEARMENGEHGAA
jgi:excisionase family DNA binding protein